MAYSDALASVCVYNTMYNYMECVGMCVHLRQFLYSNGQSCFRDMFMGEWIYYPLIQCINEDIKVMLTKFYDDIY